MSNPAELVLTEAAWAEISRHAVETFPEECCGVIISRGDDEVRRINNIQNRLHALDPQTYPRDARIAYAINPRELEAIIQEAEANGAKLKAFYHSHPDHEAYFSAEDKAFATPFGEPAYPDTAQIVVSVYNRTVKRICAYAWADNQKDFVEIPVRKRAP